MIKKIKLFKNTYMTDLKRCIFSSSFVISVLGILVAKLPGIWSDLAHYEGADVLYYYNFALSEGVFNIYYLLCAISCAPLFFNDWTSKYIKPFIVRTGTTNYCISKILATFTVSILSIFCAEFLFIGGLSSVCPLIDPNAPCQSFYNLIENGTFGPFLHKGFWAFFFAKSTLEALSGAFFAISAMCISLYIKNVFVVISFPILFQYYLSCFLSLLDLPPWLHFSFVATGQFVFGDYKTSLMYGILYFLFIITVASVFFMRKFMRGIKDAQI